MKPLFLHIFNAFWNDPAAAQHWLFGLFIAVALFFFLRALRKWPVIQPLLHALWYDETAVKRWAWGAGSFFATLASMVFVGGVDQALAWTGRQWLANIITALIALTIGMVNPVGKAKEAAAAAPPQAGFVRLPVLAGLVAGVAQAVLVGMALNDVGLTNHGWALLCLLTGAGTGALVLRAFPVAARQ